MKGSDVDLEEIEEMMRAHNLKNSARNSKVELTRNRVEQSTTQNQVPARIEIENPKEEEYKSVSSSHHPSKNSKSIQMRLSVHMNMQQLREISKEKAQKTCAICLDIVQETNLTRLDGCVHIYCFDCIENWTSQTENSCP
jgi:hypothetical protein